MLKGLFNSYNKLCHCTPKKDVQSVQEMNKPLEEQQRRDHSSRTGRHATHVAVVELK